LASNRPKHPYSVLAAISGLFVIAIIAILPLSIFSVAEEQVTVFAKKSKDKEVADAETKDDSISNSNSNNDDNNKVGSSDGHF
jgi:hypothetical protein